MININQLPQCHVNAISVQKLFEHYDETGFVYPEKKARIEPHIDLIEKNWEAALNQGQDILWTVTFNEPKLQRIGSVSLWRSTQNGWVAEHLTSTGYPAGTCGIMLNVQLQAIEKDYNSGQNWFSHNNRYAQKIFGTIEATIGKKDSCVSQFHYLSVYPNKILGNTNNISIVRCTENNHYGIYEFVKKIRGRVYAQAEGLGEDDLELNAVDDIYRKANLRRRRYIWMAFSDSGSDPLGAVIAYRGPLGFNFSFMENRCDLIISPELNNDQTAHVCHALIRKAAHAYFGTDSPLFFPLNYIPVTTDQKTAHILLKTSASFIRTYNQSVWLKKGFESWAKNTKEQYKSILETEKRKEYKKSNCKINSISVSDLFEHYKTTKFIYPQKKERIDPFMPLIKENWEKGLKAKEDILWNLTFHPPDSNRMSSLSSWRSTEHSWLTQHLASNYPAGAVAAMLSAQAGVIIERYKYKSFQNWFSPENRYASRVFGTVVETLGKESSIVNKFKYLQVDPLNLTNSSLIKVVRCNNGKSFGIYKLAKRINGNLYAKAEELDEEDIELKTVDAIYQKVGLRRRRYIWIAFIPSISEPVGAAIAYRGPLGFNFSFLENRCDLLVDKDLEPDIAQLVCSSLIKHAAYAYFDDDLSMPFPLNYIPVITDSRSAYILISSGAKLIRTYYQSIWLKEGFSAWYKHVRDISKHKKITK